MSREKFEALLPDVLCDLVAECDCPLDKRFMTDRGHCNASVRGYLEELFSREGEGTEFDGDLAWECLTAVKEADCTKASWTSLCDQIVRPLQKEGESCERDVQCEGYWQNESHCTEANICAAGPRDNRGELGEGCTDTTAPDETSTGTEDPQGRAACYLSDGLRCEQGLCVSVATEGQECERVFDCELGTYCASDLTCHPNLRLGDPCPPVINFACGFGNYCGAEETCVEQKPIGARCDSTIECASRNCTPFGTCEESGVSTVCEFFSYIEIGD